MLMCLVIIVPFLITRLPFYLYYPMVTLTPDSWTYTRQVFNILNGVLPQFDHRTPGYPLFIALVSKLFTNSNLAIVATQSMVCLGSLLYFAYVLYYNFKPSVALLAALALTAAANTITFIWSETTYMTESLYVSSLIIFFACLIQALYSKKAMYWGIASFIMGFIVWVRPSGLFLIVPMLFTTAFLVKNSHPKRLLIAFVFPFVVMMLSLATYNHFTIRSFTLSPFGANNIFAVTMPFMETDSNLPPEVRKEFSRSVGDRVTKEVKYAINNSWDIKTLHDAFFNIYPQNLAVTLELKNVLPQSPSAATALMSLYPYMNSIAGTSIKRHPLLYTKFVSVMFLYYFLNINQDEAGITGQENMYNTVIPYNIYTLISHYNTMKVSNQQNAAIIKQTLNEYAEPFPPKRNFYTIFLSKTGTGVKLELLAVHLVRNGFQAFSTAYLRYHKLLFKNIYWVVLYLIVFLYSIYVLCKSRFSSTEAFITVMIGSVPVLSAALGSLVSVAYIRYSYVVEFCYYLTIAFLPTLLSNKRL
ncbi:MAG: glycosyltransferase family 39 protein [Nitrospirae bacterium]|nr:glycosyltransferase family 39 protein [Nitrospirota bacterium]